MTRRLSRTLFALWAAVLVTAGCGGDPPAPEAGATVDSAAEAAPPNVLLLVWDTVRADRLSVHGYARDTTPRLSELARDGQVYEWAVSPAMWTLPGHASLFTGLAVTSHGVTATHKWLDQRFETLAERFAAAGYETYAFSANPFVSEKTNLTQGFATVEHPYDERWRPAVERHVRDKAIPGDRSTPLSQKRPADRASEEEQDEEDEEDEEDGAREGQYKECAPVATEAFLEWLDRQDGQRPFFAFVNTMEAHVPRIPSLESRRRVMTAAEIERSLEVDQAHHRLLGFTAGRYEIPEADVAVMSSVYDAALVDLDRANGELFDRLRERGLLDRTIVVVTSDHGENLGDHHMFGHKFCLYDTLLRVPLVMRYPPALPAGRIAEPVSTLDLFATLHRLAGIACSPSAARTFDLTDPEHPRHRGAPVFAELRESTPRALRVVVERYGEFDPTRFLRSFDAVVAGGYKLIRASDGDHELYDVRVDPGETRDLLADEAPRAERMHRLLERWRADLEPYDQDAAGPGDRRRGGMSRKMREQLEALGYAAEGGSDQDRD